MYFLVPEERWILDLSEKEVNQYWIVGKVTDNQLTAWYCHHKPENSDE